MTKDFILDLIRKGEGQTIEFKESLPQPKDLAREFCGFANTNDGYILLGVDDSKQITVIKWEDKDDLAIINIGSNNCSPHIIPTVDKVIINDKLVVLLTVQEGEDKPYKANGVVYARYGSMTRPVDREKEMRLFQNGGRLRFDTLPYKKAIVDDLVLEKIIRYLQIRAPSVRDADEKFKVLRNVGYIANGTGRLMPTGAGILCFSEFPQRFFPQAIIKCAFFKGTTKTDYIADRVTINGDILAQISRAVDFVIKNMKIAREREVERKDVPQYPIIAIKEAVTNAVVHRDYLMEGNEITLLMFEDRLEMENPGGLGGGLKSVEDIEKRRYSRNPLLAMYLLDLGEVEALGTGIKKIKDECAKLGSPPPLFEADKDFFKVTFYPKFV